MDINPVTPNDPEAAKINSQLLIEIQSVLGREQADEAWEELQEDENAFRKKYQALLRNAH